MPGCWAPRCTRSGSKGCKVHRFPVDMQRRTDWAVNVGRTDSHGNLMIPNPTSVLCEYHFEADQYELNRQDLVKKLKPFAVPTIFDHHSPVKRRPPLVKRPVRSAVLAAPAEEIVVTPQVDHTYFSPKQPALPPCQPDEDGEVCAANETVFVLQEQNQNTVEDTVPEEEPTHLEVLPDAVQVPNDIVRVVQRNEDGTLILYLNPSHQPDQIFSPGSEVPKSSSPVKKKTSVKRITKHFKHQPEPVEEVSDDLPRSARERMGRMQAKLARLQATIVAERNRNRILNRQNRNLRENLDRFLTECQISKLGKNSYRGSEWTKETLSKALDTLRACGAKGYKHLLEQNYPLPCLRTLQRYAAEQISAGSELTQIIQNILE